MSKWATADADGTSPIRTTLTHIPAANDEDDTAALLAVRVPSPESRRVTDCIAWQDKPDYYPGYLLHDVKRWFSGYIARQGVGAPYDFAAIAVAAYLLGRRDGVLTAEQTRPVSAPPPVSALPTPVTMEEDAPPDAGARAIAFALAWAGGFICCGLFVLLGFWLSY